LRSVEEGEEGKDFIKKMMKLWEATGKIDSCIEFNEKFYISNFNMV